MSCPRVPLLFAAVLAVALPAVAFAQSPSPPPARTLELRFTPTARTQIAIWIEQPDGRFLQTVKLTESVSRRGIGNRPGAAQMNSGFRWTYGRREGVLPIWAHRRSAAPNATQFRRVIFQDRRFEGDASQAETHISTGDSSPDQYFCLSFQLDTTKKQALDAVSCATAFNSDKGRYIDPATDLPAGYAEPAVVGGQAMMRALDAFSLYPPRRDVSPCCVDTPDVANYVADSRAVMPEIDTVSMATPPPDMEQSILFTVPDEWLDGSYVAWLEVNVEGDYNPTFNDQTYPTPTAPAGAWDSWAMQYGYPYRGQPSVVFQVPFVLGTPATTGTVVAYGYGDVDGFGLTGGDVRPFMPGGAITDDPSTAATQGSGADRLRLTAMAPYRLQVTVRDRKQCEMDTAPPVPGGMTVAPVSNQRHSHEWGHLQFIVPETASPISSYEVKYSKSEISPDDMETFNAAMPARAPTIDSQGLMVPTTLASGAEVEVDFGGMDPLTKYWVAVRAIDICNLPGPYVVGTLTTTRVHYTQLSGCFIATAAYGSPLEPQVQALRTARDALRPRSVVVATATDLYYRSSPAAAALLGGSDVAKAVVRTLLGPVIELARAATE